MYVHTMCIIMLCSYSTQGYTYLTFMQCTILYRRKAWQGKNLVKLLFSGIWQKVKHMNRSGIKLLMVTTNLDDYNLANHKQFITFARFSCYMVSVCEHINTYIRTLTYQIAAVAE